MFELFMTVAGALFLFGVAKYIYLVTHFRNYSEQRELYSHDRIEALIIAVGMSILIVEMCVK